VTRAKPDNVPNCQRASKMHVKFFDRLRMDRSSRRQYDLKRLYGANCKFGAYHAIEKIFDRSLLCK
jgi:hypothetical protein